MSDRPRPQRPQETRAVEFGQDLPAPSGSDLHSKSEPIPSTVRVRLHVESGPSAPAVVQIDKPVTILGRLEGVADVAVEDESASRRHAYINHREGEFTLHDMGSTNGTFLNGDLVTEAPLKHGDLIQIGTIVMRFEAKKKK